jgi:hypothetical protein
MKKSSLVLGVAAAAFAMVAIVSGASAQDTKISGRMYADFTNIDKTVDGVEADPSGTGFDIKRLYIGIDHSFNDMFSANVTTLFTPPLQTGCGRGAP